MARARDMLGEDYRVLALIGDGALTGGLAYEGLSTAGQSRGQLLVILNDNGMSITKNVGGVAEHLARQRLKPQYLTFKKYYRKVMNATWFGRKIYRVTHRLKKAVKESLLPSSLFENMGFTYLGPVNGHDLRELTEILRYARDLKEPVLLHVRTIKGKDFTPAEENPDAYHGVSPFDPETGEPLKQGRPASPPCLGGRWPGWPGGPAGLRRHGGYADRDWAGLLCPPVPGPLFRCGHCRRLRGVHGRRHGQAGGGPGGGGLFHLPPAGL